jgi:uncharacterized membrane-anchored protein
MRSAITRAVIVITALLTLGAVNYSIYAKEQIIRTGETIFLELAPVDPRSLMQGDYMALRFRLAESIQSSREKTSKPIDERSVPIALDSHNVATLATQDGDALRIRYRIRNGQVWLGTNAYFFQEGTVQRYTNARYGEFRLDRHDGEAVLVGLRDENLNPLQ